MGGGGAIVFFPESKFFFSLRSAAEMFFATSSTKTIFFKVQSANRIFFSAHFRDRIFFKIKFAVGKEKNSPKNHSHPPFQVKWMFP